MKYLIAAICILPTLSFAQVAAFDTDALVTCIDVQDDPTEAQSCIGQALEVCLNADEVNTTASMRACIAGEVAFWDEMLNTEYQRLRQDAKAVDAEGGADAPSLADALQQMQRAWIAYRDASCAYVGLSYGTGTLGGTLAYDCVMHETGKQALRLKFESLLFE